MPYLHVLVGLLIRGGYRVIAIHSGAYVLCADVIGKGRKAEIWNTSKDVEQGIECSAAAPADWDQRLWI